jgi:preprotein translocase subunit YajC
MQSGLSSLIFMGLLIGVFYFMLIRPQKKRVEQHRALISSVDQGDEVVTIGGMHGVVKTIGDDDVEIEIAPGTVVRFTRAAIARRVTEDLSDEESYDTDEEDDYSEESQAKAHQEFGEQAG